MGLWKKLKESITENLEEMLRFLMHTFFSVVWFTICASAAEATSWVRRFFCSDEIMTFLAFSILEGFFLILGIIGAAAYCYLKTKKLLVDVYNKQ